MARGDRIWSNTAEAGSVQVGMRYAFIVLGAVALSLAPVGAQAFQAKPAVTVQSLAGTYEGTATSPQGAAKVTANLLVADGKLVGTLDSGDGPIAVVGAAITGERVVLALEMAGTAGTISGVATGGRMIVWDVTFPEKRDPACTSILFPIRAKLPRTEINTGYGVRFREGQGADHYVGLAAKTGFQVVSRRNEAGWFFLELKKGGQ